MITPRLAAVIRRRVLINYRVDPVVVRPLLPRGLRPKLIDDSAVAGICLLCTEALRPIWLRTPIGWASEGAAHRIAVEWDSDDGPRHGVYIPVRHSASRLPVVVGGRLYPGSHRYARFEVEDAGERIRHEVIAPDIRIRADVATGATWSSSLFATPADASEFFRAGLVCWSPARNGRGLEGRAMHPGPWALEPATALRVESSFFEGMPAGTALLDSAFVMRDVPITWSAPGSAAPGQRSSSGRHEPSSTSNAASR